MNIVKAVFGVLLALGGLFAAAVAYSAAGGYEGFSNFHRDRLLRGDGLTASIISFGLFFVALVALGTIKRKPLAPLAAAPTGIGGGSGVPFGPGAAVLVQWSDGNRYPGVVAQASPGQCFVVMASGQRLWVPLANVFPG
jgi:hypothetical protein